MIATSFNNNVFEGTFEGTVRTGSGRTAHISNGRFRIRLAFTGVTLSKIISLLPGKPEKSTIAGCFSFYAPASFTLTTLAEKAL